MSNNTISISLNEDECVRLEDALGHLMHRPIENGMAECVFCFQQVVDHSEAMHTDDCFGNHLLYKLMAQIDKHIE